MAVIIGLTVAFVIKWIYIFIDQSLFPLPPGLDPSDMDAIKEYYGQLPNSNFLLALSSNVVMTFGAAFTAVKVAATQYRNIALGLGLFLLVMGLIKLFTIPHPIWFTILDLVLYIPVAGFGYRMAKR